jgi:hypothetical protein
MCHINGSITGKSETIDGNPPDESPENSIKSLSTSSPLYEKKGFWLTSDF